jgi:hypothetical protein
VVRWAEAKTAAKISAGLVVVLGIKSSQIGSVARPVGLA